MIGIGVLLLLCAAGVTFISTYYGEDKNGDYRHTDFNPFD